MYSANVSPTSAAWLCPCYSSCHLFPYGFPPHFPPIISPSRPHPSLPPTLGLRTGQLPVVWSLPPCGRYFHSPTDTKELLYDPASVMNGDTLKFCLKEAWCKLSFFVLSFFYYLYWWAPEGQCWVIIGLHAEILPCHGYNSYLRPGVDKKKKYMNNIRKRNTHIINFIPAL